MLVQAKKLTRSTFFGVCNTYYCMFGLSVLGGLGYTGAFFEYYKDNFTMEDKEESSTYFMVCLASAFIQIVFGNIMRTTTTNNNNVYSIQQAADLNDIPSLHDATRIQPFWRCFSNPGSRGINDIIPENGLRPLSYLASKRWSRGIKELLTPFTVENDWNPEYVNRAIRHMLYEYINYWIKIIIRLICRSRHFCLGRRYV